MGRKVNSIEGLKTNLIEVTEGDAADIIALRNNPEFNRFLSSQKPISVEEQIEWIRKNKERNDNFYFKITDKQGRFKGTVSLYRIANGEAEFGRFIATNPIAAAEAEYLILKFGFEELNLEKIYCNTIEENRKVIQMHSRFGFRTVGKKKNDALNCLLIVQEMTRDEFSKINHKSILLLLERLS